MAGSVNKVVLVGRLGRDPEVRTFQNGGKVCNLRVATSETWRDKASGEKKERTEWHSVAITSEPLADFAERYLRKGSMVYVEGKLETRKWQDKSGADRYSTEVVIRPYGGELVGLSNYGADDESSGSRDAGRSAGGGGRSRDGAAATGQDGRGRQDLLDDDIPF